MPRVALLILAITVLAVGAGFVFLNGQSTASAVNASPVISSGASQETVLTSTSSPAPAEVIPAANAMYGSDIESELTTFTYTSDGHFCDGEGKSSSSGY